MKKIISYFFSNWWWSFLLFIISSVIFIIYMLFVYGVLTPSYDSLLIIFVLIAYVISIILLLASSIYTIIRRRWVINFSIILFIILGGGATVFIISNRLMEMFQPDGFSDNLKIPKNIELNIPIGERFGNENIENNAPINRVKSDFELYNSQMAGTYDFVIWTEKIASGVVYLKAYEITGEHALSSNDLAQNSAIRVYNPNSGIMKFGPSSFIIHEGDWNKFYAARFEVWFLPDVSSEKERKLMEKNYKIEGYSN